MVCSKVSSFQKFSEFELHICARPAPARIALLKIDMLDGG